MTTTRPRTIALLLGLCLAAAACTAFGPADRERPVCDAKHYKLEALTGLDAGGDRFVEWRLTNRSATTLSACVYYPREFHLVLRDGQVLEGEYPYSLHHVCSFGDAFHLRSGKSFVWRDSLALTTPISQPTSGHLRIALAQRPGSQEDSDAGLCQIELDLNANP